MKRNRNLAELLRLTSAFAFGLAVGVQGAIGLFGLPYPEPSEEKRKSKREETLTIEVNKPQPTAPLQQIDAIAPGLLPTPGAVVAQHGPYVSAFDLRTRNPAWACLKLEKRSKEVAQSEVDEPNEKADRSLSKFKPDKNVPELFRTKPEDFKASGFDRGHLVAAGDVTRQEHMDETFLMSNISPQVGVGLNRGFWQMLERFVRRLTKAYEDIYVCSGPLFLPEFDEATNVWQVKYQVIGPQHDIAVPTHFFKCILARTGEKSSQTCFVVPNRPVDHLREPLSKFETTVEEVERLAGFQLFPDSRAKTRQLRSVCDEIKCDLAREQIFPQKSAKQASM